LQEVVVQATRVGQKSPVPHNNLLSAKINQILQAQDVPQLLSAIPSVVESSDAGTGIGYTGLRIRGSDPTRVNVTINGVPLNDAESQGVYWVNLPDLAASAAEIQVQRGVGTSSNGAGAFGATVNIDLSKVSPDPAASITSTAGAFNTRKFSAQMNSGLLNGKWAFSGRVSRINSDGYIDRASAALGSMHLSAAFIGEKQTAQVHLLSGHEKTYQAWNGTPAQFMDHRYSTKAVAHTLKTYSKYSIPFPYPTAISVEAQNGMEYPMICFNPGRAEPDGTYSEEAKNAALTVIFHEVGHNYFPMIINSDERQWAWFDEGINTFMQYLAEQEWDNNYDSDEGPPHKITDYMALPKDKLEPIMTNSENIVDYFSNAYRKPATALNILRETVMGREKFDYAFREYCRRWAFKHPTPADFFRTLEDASGMDLDWFWRGWFMSIDAVDISLDSVVWKRVDLENDPERQVVSVPQEQTKPFETLTKTRYRTSGTVFPVEQDTTLQDYYTFNKPWETADSISFGTSYLYDVPFSRAEKEQLFGDKQYYELHFSNKGGLVMPVILEWTYQDGTEETERIPVEIWRKNERNFNQVFVKSKPVQSVRLDPWRETADIDEKNNTAPIPKTPVLFKVYKKDQFKPGPNMMQKDRQRKEKKS
jgi:hypothetical protein